ncbi:hypothetical protein QFC20_006233 [Naganishia adeliensis]|uniref:Uncharacterized protein n=1 Tax=Naganishia adeliensis TaxID=92952 RepID=A0ACC2VEG6_9TREE|nr:hypothetical protein QFC20_006233 [Naganishia adeliensis]
MRSSTILLLTLRALSQEAIKNLVLAGVGRLIVMDDQVVSERDLGAGLLFREKDGDVGKMASLTGNKHPSNIRSPRVLAALPQIKSLNPLVTVTPLSTLSPFVVPASGEQPTETIEEFLKREKVDLVCATDLAKEQLSRINQACRDTNTLFYGAGSYGYFGYIFNDLGDNFEWVTSQTSSTTTSNTTITSQAKAAKKQVSYSPFEEALSKSNPFEGLKRNETRDKLPALVLGILAVWEYQSRHNGNLPESDEATAELHEIAEKKRVDFGINEKALKAVPEDVISHLAKSAPCEFAPTAAILGGLLAQDILRALSRKEKPIMNLLCVDTMGGNGAVTRWGLSEEVDV